MLRPARDAASEHHQNAGAMNSAAVDRLNRVKERRRSE
jgi:hypothetical protein